MGWRVERRRGDSFAFRLKGVIVSRRDRYLLYFARSRCACLVVGNVSAYIVIFS